MYLNVLCSWYVHVKIVLRYCLRIGFLNRSSEEFQVFSLLIHGCETSCFKNLTTSYEQIFIKKFHSIKKLLWSLNKSLFGINSLPTALFRAEGVIRNGDEMYYTTIKKKKQYLKPHSSRVKKFKIVSTLQY